MRLIFPLLFLATNIFSQPEIYFNYNTFQSPTKGPFVETYLSVIGSSLKFTKNTNKKYQAKLEIGLLFLQNDSIKAARKYVLNSDELTDTLKKPNFLDQQRFLLKPGMYDLEITRKDNNIPNGKTYTSKTPIHIIFPKDSISTSGIQFLESYKKSEAQTELTKNGLDMIPYVSDFYPENIKALKFYLEIYNTQKILGSEEKFLVNYYIQSYEIKQTMSGFSSFSKQTASIVNPLLSEFNIEQLPSGNYNLVVDIKNKNNELVASPKIFFQRSNPKVALKVEDLATTIMKEGTYFASLNNKDTLIDFIKSTRAIATESEKAFSDKKLDGYDITLLKQYFSNFWNNRNPQAPEKEWFAYYKQVLKVNNEFGTQNRKGYDTDRGRIYLKYGPPNQRNVLDREPNTYPYEIWQYYKLNEQSNRKFVFYLPDLVSNNYQLLHSDARGERRNENWQVILEKRIANPFNLDVNKNEDNFGGNSNNLYNNPR